MRGRNYSPNQAAGRPGELRIACLLVHDGRNKTIVRIRVHILGREEQVLT